MRRATERISNKLKHRTVAPGLSYTNIKKPQYQRGSCGSLVLRTYLLMICDTVGCGGTFDAAVRRNLEQTLSAVQASTYPSRVVHFFSPPYSFRAFVWQACFLMLYIPLKAV
jgi:hypothetical protein